MYERKNFITNINIQFDTPYTPIMGSSPVNVNMGAVVLDGQGGNMYPPTFSYQQLVSADLTPEVVEAINDALAYTGFKLVKAD